MRGAETDLERGDLFFLFHTSLKPGPTLIFLSVQYDIWGMISASCMTASSLPSVT